MGGPVVLVQNVSGVSQVVGRVNLPPGKLSEVPTSVADALFRAGSVTLRFEEGITRLDGGKPAIFWMSPFSLCDGYGVVAANLLRVVVRNGVSVFPRRCWFSPEEGVESDIAPLLRRELPGPLGVGFCLAQANHFWKLPTPYRVGYTMYETSDPLSVRGEWRYDMQYIDQLIVPSAYCAEVFDWVKVPVSVIPLPVHDAFLNPVRRKAKETFTFVTYGTLTGRKSPLELVSCFRRAFPLSDFPRVHLELKTRLGYFGWGANFLERPDDPRITVHNEAWDRSKLLSWLYAADAFVFPSKGEGFGMPPREALATGLPVILSENSGLLDLLDGEYMWGIPEASREPCALGGTWSIPDWDFLVDTLREVYENREAAYERGFRGGKWFTRYHGPDRVGKKFYRFFDNLDPSVAEARRKVVGERELPEEFFRCLSATFPGGGRDFLIVGGAEFEEHLAGRGFYGVRVERLSEVPAVKERFRYALCDAGWATYDVGVLRSLLRRALFVAKRLICFIPSEFYGGIYTPDMRMLSLGDWEFILSPFDATVRFLEDTDRRFFWLEVERRDGSAG